MDGVPRRRRKKLPSTETSQGGNRLDTLLTSTGVVVAIITAFGEKEPAVIIFLLAVLFGVLIHPVVSLASYVPAGRLRPISRNAVVVILLLVGVGYFGLRVWPKPTLPQANLWIGALYFPRETREHELIARIHEANLGKLAITERRHAGVTMLSSKEYYII
jgi:hypothetical protein